MTDDPFYVPQITNISVVPRLVRHGTARDRFNKVKLIRALKRNLETTAKETTDE